MKEVAKIILVNRNGELLLQLRDNNPAIPCPGMWSLFGGGLEENEDGLKGVMRECDEELPNCRIYNVHLLFDEINSNFHHIFFIGNIYENIEKINKNLTEGQKAGYFKISKLKNIKIDDTAKGAINKYFSYGRN
jgi:ADP-ribose pyrophosphatase YjhB (NUDIX family)